MMRDAIAGYAIVYRRHDGDWFHFEFESLYRDRHDAEIVATTRRQETGWWYGIVPIPRDYVAPARRYRLSVHLSGDGDAI